MSLEISARISFYLSSLSQNGSLDVVYKPKLRPFVQAYEQAQNEQATQASIGNLIKSAVFNELVGNINNMMSVDSILTEGNESDFSSEEFTYAFAVALIQVLLAK